MPLMRAKFLTTAVEHYNNVDRLFFRAVCSDVPYGPNGESEDNTFARYTPSADLSMSVTNPDLAGKIAQGDVFYVDFTKVEATPAT